MAYAYLFKYIIIGDTGLFIYEIIQHNIEQSLLLLFRRR